MGVDPDYIDFAIKRRYQINRKIGRGPYSVVWHGFTADREPVAIKRVFNAFQNRNDAQRTYREVSLLTQLSDHPNIVSLRETLNSRDDRDLYLLFEYMSSDLSTAIRANVLKPVHRELVMWQLLCAFKYIHSAGVVHRDLRPSSVLISSRCEVRVCDFGQARLSQCMEISNSTMTEYQSSRWYRSPEQLLRSRAYSYPVDLWALGCLLAEILLTRPLFSGTSTLSQLELVVSFCGRPNESDMKALDCEETLDLLMGMGHKKAADIEQMIPNATFEARDMVRMFLRVAPDLRMTAEEALEHPFVSRFHNPDEEPVSSKLAHLSLDDDTRHSVNTYRDYVYANSVGDSEALDRIRQSTTQDSKFD